MKTRPILVLAVIIISLLPAYSINKYLQKALRPRESGKRLLAYLLSAMLLVFVYTTLLVLFIRWVFPNA